MSQLWRRAKKRSSSTRSISCAHIPKTTTLLMCRHRLVQIPLMWRCEDCCRVDFIKYWCVLSLVLFRSGSVFLSPMWSSRSIWLMWWLRVGGHLSASLMWTTEKWYSNIIAMQRRTCPNFFSLFPCIWFINELIELNLLSLFRSLCSENWEKI